MNDQSPRTLRDVLQNQEGFELQVGYSLALTHGCMGYYPAIFTGTKRVVLVFDLELLEAVWKMLPPRRSEADKGLCYVNFAEGIAFPVSLNKSLEELLSGEAMPVLTQSEFEQVTADGAVPFSWAPGLVGNDMSKAEFQETLQVALAEGPVV